MNSIMTVYLTAFTVLIFGLVAFAIFMIGFLVGYKNEEKKIFRNKQRENKNQMIESEWEKKTKKEWKKFLEYDGSIPEENNGL